MAKINIHMFSCKNYHYHVQESHPLGAGTKTKSHIATTENTEVGAETYERCLEDCMELYNSIFVNNDFWLLINKYPIYLTDVTKHFESSDYSMLELLTIMNELNKVPSYTLLEYEKGLTDCAALTVKSRLSGLDTALCAIECRKFLDAETDFIRSYDLHVQAKNTIKFN